MRPKKSHPSIHPSVRPSVRRRPKNLLTKSRTGQKTQKRELLCSEHLQTVFCRFFLSETSSLFLGSVFVSPRLVGDTTPSTDVAAVYHGWASIYRVTHVVLVATACDVTQWGICVTVQTSHKYYSACICARAKCAGVVVTVTRRRCRVSCISSLVWHSRRVRTIPAYVTRFLLALPRVPEA